MQIARIGLDSEICLRDSRRRRSWKDGAAQDASSSRRVNVFRKPAAVPYRHGSLERRTLLGEDALDLGHDVRLISPQFVTPYVKSNKNDRNDAEAICEAVGRPNMRFVPVKSAEQLAVQAVHRIARAWLLIASGWSIRSAVFSGSMALSSRRTSAICGELWRGSATMRTAPSIPWFAR